MPIAAKTAATLSRSNLLSVLMQVFVSFALITVLCCIYPEEEEREGSTSPPTANGHAT